MRFIFDPTEGALIPELTKEAIDRVSVTVLDVISRWLVESGLPLAAEIMLVWGIVCFGVACSGSGAWLERGTKAVLLSIMLGAVRYAV